MSIGARLVGALPALLVGTLLAGLAGATGHLPDGGPGGGPDDGPAVRGSADARPYAALFRGAAARYPTVSAAQLAAHARAESGFDPRARSPVGARGLMQIMPGTFREFAVDGDGDGRTDPDAAADSVYTGARYLAWLGRELRMEVSDPRVVAAYNAGPGAVTAAGGVPAYAETRTYVERVGRWTPGYRWLDG